MLHENRDHLIDKPDACLSSVGVDDRVVGANLLRQRLGGHGPQHNVAALLHAEIDAVALVLGGDAPDLGLRFAGLPASPQALGRTIHIERLEIRITLKRQRRLPQEALEGLRVAAFRLGRRQQQFPTRLIAALEGDRAPGRRGGRPDLARREIVRGKFRMDPGLAVRGQLAESLGQEFQLVIRKLAPRLGIAGEAGDKALFGIAAGIELPLLITIEIPEPGMPAIVARAVDEQRWDTARLAHLRGKVGLIRADPAGGKNLGQFVGATRPHRPVVRHAVVAVADHRVRSREQVERIIGQALGPFELGKWGGGIDDKLQFVGAQAGEPVVGAAELLLLDPPGKSLTRCRQFARQGLRRHLAMRPDGRRRHVVNHRDGQGQIRVGLEAGRVRSVEGVENAENIRQVISRA
ncbi:MAG: hypothetical protein EXS38_03940 [Opitutus sp.]|nr:hypothetical protein [Opitutus sp.]